MNWPLLILALPIHRSSSVGTAILVFFILPNNAGHDHSDTGQFHTGRNDA